MEFTWTVPVAVILGGTAYAISARYFAHRERLARLRADDRGPRARPVWRITRNS